MDISAADFQMIFKMGEVSAHAQAISITHLLHRFGRAKNVRGHMKN
jgi:hypothetical protein